MFKTTLQEIPLGCIGVRPEIQVNLLVVPIPDSIEYTITCSDCAHFSFCVHHYACVQQFRLPPNKVEPPDNRKNRAHRSSSKSPRTRRIHTHRSETLRQCEMNLGHEVGENPPDNSQANRPRGREQDLIARSPISLLESHAGARLRCIAFMRVNPSIKADNSQGSTSI